MMKITLCHQSVASGSGGDELDVLEQIKAVEASLQRLGMTTSVLPVSLNLGAAADAILSQKPQLIFNLVESLNERGEMIATFPGLLESMDRPYTGSSADALYLSSNKLLARERLASLGLPIAGDPSAALDARYIVKSVWEHASKGMDQDSVVGLARVEEEIAAREERFGGEFFAEAYLEGREFNVALLQTKEGVQVLPIAEMLFLGYGDGVPHIVDYAAKWDPNSSQYAGTERRFLQNDEDALKSRLSDLARRCWDGFGLSGYARVDFRAVGDEIFVIDINANPCLSPDAGFSSALSQAKIPFDQAIEWIVETALERSRPTRGNKRTC
jgi:D-alanine-D-alanine ligase